MDLILSETLYSVRVNGHNLSLESNVPSLSNGHKPLKYTSEKQRIMVFPKPFVCPFTVGSDVRAAID